jgi:putative glutamine amidotransferase
MNIAITDSMGSGRTFDLYVRWITDESPDVRWTKLSYLTDRPEECAGADGVILSGGGDVDPSLYGGDAGHRELDRVDRRRDDFERRIIDVAIQKRIPLLGICRGMQIINVHFGGSLYEDLPDHGRPAHRSDTEGGSWHSIAVETGSLLESVTGTVAGNVNSYHHQAVKRIGDELKISAYAGDGVPESLECVEATEYPFVLGVQWHPERMEDGRNPFCSSVRNRFIKHLRSQRQQ